MNYMFRSLALCAIASLSSLASANPPFSPDLIKGGNRWTITFYDDSSPNHNQWATQGICFYYAGTVGTQQRYLWVSDTYPDWNGRATQEGDQIFMHGDFQWPFGTRNGGHDGMEWEITTVGSRNEGFGHWKEWVETSRFGTTIGFGNAKFRRVGKCRRPGFTSTFALALDASQRIERKEDKNGELEVNPMGISEKIILERQEKEENNLQENVSTKSK